MALAGNLNAVRGGNALELNARSNSIHSDVWNSIRPSY